MINDYTISNFKCINSGSVSFKPITIFCGPNSSGKSSLLQSLLLLKQSLNAMNGIHTLAPTGNIIDLGSFEDLIASHDTKKTLRYNFSIKPNDPYVTRALSMINTSAKEKQYYRIIKDINFNFEYNYIAEEEKIELSQISTNDNSGFYIKSRTNKDGSHWFSYGDDKNKKRTNPKIKSLSNFLAPEMAKEYLFSDSLTAFKSEKVSAIRRLLQVYLKSLYQELSSLNYLGPFRQIPNRFYMTGGGMPSDIGYRGESSIDYLSYTKLTGDNDIIRFVEHWLKKLNHASKFDIETVQSIIKKVTLRNPNTNIDTTLVDVGFGISQVLPVIIAIYRHKSGIHFFEQPEIHLHPKSQGDLADLFIDNIKPNTSYVIETHSEHFLNRIRYRIAERSLKPDKATIYYIDQNKEGFKLKQITIDESGSFKGFPPNFFDEAYQESVKIMQQRTKNL